MINALRILCCWFLWPGMLLFSGSTRSQQLLTIDTPLYHFDEQHLTPLMKDICIAWDSLRQHRETAGKFPNSVPQALKSKNQEEQTYAHLYSAMRYIRQGSMDDAIFHTQSARYIVNTEDVYPGLRLLFHGTYALLLRKLELYNLAIPEYYHCLRLLRQKEYKPVIHWLNIYSSLAACHSYEGNADSTIFYRKQFLRVAQQRNEHLKIASGLNNIGMNYREVAPDTALACFHRALRALRLINNEDSVFRQSIIDNFGLLFLQMGHLDSAAFYFEKNLEWAGRLEDTSRLIQTQLELAAIALQEKDAEKMLAWLESSKRMLQCGGCAGKHTLRQRLWKLFEQYALLTDDDKAARLHSQKAYAITDSLHLLESRSLRSAIAKLNRLKLETAEKERLFLVEKEKSTLRKARLQQMLAFTAIAFAIVICGVVVMRYRWRQQRLKKENQLLETREQLALTEIKKKELDEIHLKQSLELKQKDVANMAINLAEKERFTAEVVAKLEKIAAPGKRPLRPQLENLCRELDNSRQLSEKSLALQVNIAEVNQEFYRKLKRAFPTLSKSEAELCALFRTGLDGKEISVMKNITMPSLRTIRSRIRKKMNLPADQDLSDFLQDI